MKQFFLSILCLFVITSLIKAQDFTYKVTPMPAVAPAGVATMGGAPGFGPNITFLAPPPGGEAAQNELDKIKERVAQRFPRRDNVRIQPRAIAEPPAPRQRFEGPSASLGIPLDTHLAISDEGQVVVVANFEVAVYDTLGNQLARENLQDFFMSVNPVSTIFDPKVHYDPEEDRFVIIALARLRQDKKSRIYFAFSQSNDATGNWNTYEVEGDPFNTNSFFDYPMASLSHDELFLTGNSVDYDLSWQAGFVETLIYQVDKFSGYNGDSLRFHIWNNLSALGVFLRNLCPVKGATGNYGPNHYFLSNRNFTVANDTIILIQIYDTIGQSLPQITMEVHWTGEPYGAPPNARQLGNNTLATNDARILDALIFNGRIQFVGNSVNMANGFPAIYYGWMDTVGTSGWFNGRILSSDTLEFGYPSLAYTGSGDLQENAQDVVIFADYTQDGKFPGTGAFYVDNNGDVSDFIIGKEGQNLINVLQSADERWGDYTGCQRKYNRPGEVWTMGTFGIDVGARRLAFPHITQWYRPDIAAGSEHVNSQLDLTVYPNPTSSRVQLDFSAEAGQQVEILLMDMQGKALKRFFRHPSDRAGQHRFSFDTRPLATGSYMLRILVDGNTAASRKLLVN
ncbi:MAG: T9SS type A sorting domain-containing protein [Bacteroidia bacterium]